MYLARTQTSQRVLPPVSATPAGPLHGLVAAAGWRVLAGVGLEPRRAVARLLRLHREALAAESEGRWATARFWWGELRRQWQSLPADHPGWAAVLDREAAGLAGTPAE